MSAEPDAQILRGTLYICVLALIQCKDSYGYELVEELRASDFPAVKSGIIYPILRHLICGSVVLVGGGHSAVDRHPPGLLAAAISVYQVNSPEPRSL